MTGRRRGADGELTLMAHVARKHYLGGMSKSEIAEQLYLSRFKVARLLESARAQGIVRFEIGLPGNVNLNLSRELEDAFSLRHAVVIDDEADSGRLFARLGEATVALLSDIVQEADLVGLAATRTLMAIEEPVRNLPPCTFVQLTGQLPRPDASDVINGIRNLTRSSGGSAHVFYAPMIAGDEEAQRSYLSHPDVLRAFGLFPRLDVIVTGVGAWSPEKSVMYDNLPEEVRTEAARAGAVAEIVGVPIDAAGRTVTGRARDRMVAPDIEQLSGARERVAVVFDPEKAPAVRIALAAGHVNTLVTHRTMAEALLVL